MEMHWISWLVLLTRRLRYRSEVDDKWENVFDDDC
jgi:hypothetical protein